jgi:hypothetical protein
VTIVLTALAFCVACSLLLRAPMAILYIVGFPLLGVVAWLALVTVSPLIAVAVLVLGLTAGLTRHFERR